MYTMFRFCTVAILMLPVFADAQTHFTIKGKVIDDSTAAPVGYATISLPESSSKTMTNEEGLFVFHLPDGARPGSIHITHIGYEWQEITLKGADTLTHIIRLHRREEILTAVTVTTINPLELLKKATDRIPANYSAAPYVLNGFYRMAGYKNKAAIDLSEGVFDIYNKDYSNTGKQFKVIRARLDKDLSAFGGIDGINFGVTPRGIIADDIVANTDESGLLNKQDIKDYEFHYEGMTDYEGQNAYVIGYDQKAGIKKSLYKGKIYIAADDLAFVRISMYRSPRGLAYWRYSFKQRLLLQLSGIQIQQLQDSGYITYHKYGSKYYLNHVYGTGSMNISGGRNHFEIKPLRLKYNLLVTGIDTLHATPFSKEEILHSAAMMESRSPDINSDSADAWWGAYNHILPDFNVDSAIRTIRAGNATIQYKEQLAARLKKLPGDKALRTDSLLSFYYQKGQFNGTALVKYQGKVIYEKGFGWANKAKQLPNTGQTQFRIGSTSKQFTAMLILQLAHAHQLNLEDSAGKYLPGFRNGRVTIAQLLSHQSGIPNYLEQEAYTAEILAHTFTTGQLISSFCSDSLEFEPGSNIHYSNSGYVVLAGIIEKITGKKYGEVLAQQLFIPLGMTHSYFSKKNQDTSLLATGYVNEEPELAYPVENEVGAGGITSTAEDLLRWHDALSTEQLLPRNEIDTLFKPRVQWDEWGAWYGYGWMIDRLQFEAAAKHTIQYHPGTEVGFYDMLVRQPDKDIFIILLNNKSDFPRFDMTDLLLTELNR